MNIHADISKRVVIDTNQEPWVDSPALGVQRRMLSRMGDEIAIATSIVRYAPHSQFASHVHERGEEILVLDGIFCDEHGNYPKGTYLRNPWGSTHTPRSLKGCTIFVKLRQMARMDMTRVCILPTPPHTYDDSKPTCTLLHTHAHERVQIEHWPARHRGEARNYPHGAEFLILEGTWHDEHGCYTTHTWVRLPQGSTHAPHTKDSACVVWIKQGHLSF